MRERHQIIIVGGGFAGLYAALEFEQLLSSRTDIALTIVNQDNFFLFTPMLHEVAAGDLDASNIVNPIRKLLKRVSFFEGTILGVTLADRTVSVQHGFDGHQHELHYDQLILTMGSTTHFFDLPGIEEHALTMKSLTDAVRLRNRLIALLEEADSDCSAGERTDLLSIAVAGAGFAGIETLASINDFLKHSLRFYPNLLKEQLKLTLIHPGSVILPELSPKLGKYAQTKLAERGVEVRAASRVASYDGQTVGFTDGSSLTARTLIWTAGTHPHPLIATLPCQKEHGRVQVSTNLALSGWPGVWALGDCAVVPDLSNGTSCPPTAQHALRQGKIAAQNALAFLDGKPLKAFRFKSPGQLATIGHRAGVASLFGVNISGFVAWWIWRTIYLSKLPRLEKKVRVALDWTLDLLFTKDLCRFADAPNTLRTTSHELREALEAVKVESR